jgi:hypothetical protein
MRGLSYVYCAHHHKVAYTSKKEARRARRILHRSDHKEIYECTQHSGTFHLGDLPYHVKNRSLVSRRERAERERARPTPLVMPQRIPSQRSGS